MEQDSRTLCNEGVVKKIDNGKLFVEITVLSACAGCHAKSVCFASQRKGEVLEIENGENEAFVVGELVTVYMQEKLGTLAVLLAYFFPFLILITTFILSFIISDNELVAFSFAIILTGGYYAIVALLNRKKKIDRKFVFSVKKCSR
ncbi:SoxR reducing system RseC family protein [Bacteroidales bacterium OttesenSCG-928-L19]|nr:SoxR reducing system RseC family protein [Bacteroidales bacterium OttesenSCG-928-L19]